MHNAEFRQCLETMDVPRALAIWNAATPGLPVPSDPEAAMHMARTQSESISLRLRAYSHRWLTERGLPSQLPDRLRQSAERMYPTVVRAVGISVNYSSADLEPLAVEVRKSMEDSVMESFADGKSEDTEFVKSRMMEARKYTIGKLLGRVG